MPRSHLSPIPVSVTLADVYARLQHVARLINELRAQTDALQRTDELKQLREREERWLREARATVVEIQSWRRKLATFLARNGRARFSPSRLRSQPRALPVLRTARSRARSFMKSSYFAPKLSSVDRFRNGPRKCRWQSAANLAD
jgi:hypothetical protein